MTKPVEEKPVQTMLTYYCKKEEKMELCNEMYEKKQVNEKKKVTIICRCKAMMSAKEVFVVYSRKIE